ncbi:MAG: OmpH family outer membrane protein [Chitinophagaceae bacterium]|nr:OmpH family outer membrane protein [Chitinophagaceae bacterium]
MKDYFKYGLIGWNVVLTLVAGYLLFTELGGKKNTATTKNFEKDTVAINKPVKIAYFEMDSIASGFNLVKSLNTELKSKENAIETEVTNGTRNLQQKFNYYQNLDKEGKLTPEQAQNATLELKKMEEEVATRKNKLEQEYMDYRTRRQNDIKTKIESFIKDFNKGRGYTFVVSDDPGLFYYRDTTFNITKDVIRGLNEMYKEEKK